MLSLTFWLVAAAILSIALLGVLIRSPLARHFIDLPGHRKVHQAAIPRLGGIGIVLAFLVLMTLGYMFGVWQPGARLLLSIVSVSLFLLIAGTFDDVLSLGYKAKFLFQFLLAGVVVCVFGLYFHQVSLFGVVVPLGGAGMVVSIFWLVGLMNAVNLVDGIDGLAGSVAIAGFAGAGALAYAAGALAPVGVCVVLSGAVIGFLFYNFQERRKVFLGDTGSQFLGAMLGVLTLEIHDLPSVGQSALIPLLLAGYPVLDVSVAMTRRFLWAQNRDLSQRILRMFLADSDHMHHRLLYTGLSHVQATILLLSLASGFTAAAVILPQMNWQWELGITVYLASAVFFLLNRLGFVQAGRIRRAVRTWMLGGEHPEDKRFASRYSRYYEIFVPFDPDRHPADAISGLTEQKPGGAYASFGTDRLTPSAVGRET